jgi:hypothetical protein
LVCPFGYLTNLVSNIKPYYYSENSDSLFEKY